MSKTGQSCQILFGLDQVRLDSARTAKPGSRRSASLVRASDLLKNWRKAILLGAGNSDCQTPVR